MVVDSGFAVGGGDGARDGLRLLLEKNRSLNFAFNGSTI